VFEIAVATSSVNEARRASVSAGSGCSTIEPAAITPHATKDSLLSRTLSVSPSSELDEARLHVARWIGFESPQGRRLPALVPGAIVDAWALPPYPMGCAAWRPVRRCGGRRRGAVIESMNGARFAHDRLEEHGWDVLIADATKVNCLAPLACTTDKIDARVLATLSARDLVRGLRGADRCRQARVRIRRQRRTRRTRRTRRDRAVGESATTGSKGRPRPGGRDWSGSAIASRRSAARFRLTTAGGTTLLVEIRLDGQGSAGSPEP
jgi:hypothetical protein